LYRKGRKGIFAGVLSVEKTSTNGKGKKDGPADYLREKQFCDAARGSNRYHVDAGEDGNSAAGGRDGGRVWGQRSTVLARDKRAAAKKEKRAVLEGSRFRSLLRKTKNTKPIRTTEKTSRTDFEKAGA